MSKFRSTVRWLNYVKYLKFYSEKQKLLNFKKKISKAPILLLNVLGCINKKVFIVFGEHK